MAGQRNTQLQTEKLNWSDLQVYLVAIQQGTLTAAAETLKVNRTTVSRRIQALEQQLGMTLLEHDSQGYRANDAGLQLLESAHRIEAEVRRLQQQLHDRDYLLSGNLKVAAPLGLGPEFMPDFALFNRRYPDISLEFVNTLNPVESLMQRKADIALSVSNYCPGQLKGECLVTLKRGLYASKLYMDHYGNGKTLQQHVWVGWGKGMSDTLAARWLQQNLAPETRISSRVNSWHAMKEAVASGLGVGQLWCFLADDNPDLIALEPEVPELSMGLWSLQNAEIPLTPRAECFVRFMAQRLQKRIPG